jgi:adenylate cyclase class 2
MKQEIEKLYWDINVDELKSRLKEVGAKMIKPEYLQKRVVFNFGNTDRGYEWLRLREEGDITKLTYKITKKGEYAKEVETKVGNFESTRKILKLLNIKETSYQENKREIYDINNVEVTIDTWPFLNPVCEIEAETEEDLFEVEKLLDLNIEKSISQNINSIYKMIYGKYIEELEPDEQMNITFQSKNPFK